MTTNNKRSKGNKCTYNDAAPDEYTTCSSKTQLTNSHHDSNQKCNGANHDLYCLKAKQSKNSQIVTI